MGDSGTLYEQDFLRWSEEQAATLRRTKNSNLPLDWENLAEEIDSLGKFLRRELSSQIRRILRHLFKLAASPAAQPRLGWQATLKAARNDAAQVLDDSPSLRREVDALIAKQLPVAAELAAADLVRHGEPADAVSARLAQGGFDAEQVLGDWIPDPPT